MSPYHTALPNAPVDGVYELLGAPPEPLDWARLDESPQLKLHHVRQLGESN